MTEKSLPRASTAPAPGLSEQHPEPIITVGCVVLGGPWFVQLKGNGDEPVLIGPYPNRRAAHAEAERLRQAVAAATGPNANSS